MTCNNPNCCQHAAVVKDAEPSSVEVGITDLEVVRQRILGVNQRIEIQANRLDRAVDRAYGSPPRVDSTCADPKQIMLAPMIIELSIAVEATENLADRLKDAADMLGRLV